MSSAASAILRCAMTAKGQIREVRARNWAVRFTLKNRHRQPGLSGPKSAITGSRCLLNHVVGTDEESPGFRRLRPRYPWPLSGYL